MDEVASLVLPTAFKSDYSDVTLILDKMRYSFPYRYLQKNRNREKIEN